MLKVAQLETLAELQQVSVVCVDVWPFVGLAFFPFFLFFFFRGGGPWLCLKEDRSMGG